MSVGESLLRAKDDVMEKCRWTWTAATAGRIVGAREAEGW
jgi:hypothetical protein